jgi:hypothetical protein
VGPDEDSTLPAEDRKPCQRRGRRPRTRGCLLKGCERRFHPQRAGQRYCSDECRRAARRWSRWKAQQSYRATAAGKERRNGQSRRYRQRVRNRRSATPEEPVPEAARVITHKVWASESCVLPFVNVIMSLYASLSMPNRRQATVLIALITQIKGHDLHLTFTHRGIISFPRAA